MACKQLAICGTKDAVPALAALLSDPRLASSARIALEAIPGPAPDAALRKAMGRLQGKLLVGTINSIAVRRDPKAVDGLVKKLHDADAEVASAAAVALGRIGGAKAAKALDQCLPPAPSISSWGFPSAGGAKTLNLRNAPTAVLSAIAEGCILCAERFMAQGNFADAVNLYDAVRGADVPRQKRLEALRGAILARQSAGLPLLLEELRSPDKGRFAIGLRTARELPGAEVTEALVAELKRCSPDRQALLLLAVADRGDAAAGSAVLEAAQSGPTKVRIVAIGVLERRGNLSSVPVLLAIAASGEADVAPAALNALTRLPGNGVDSDLLARLPQATGKTRQVLIELATQRRIEPALPSIVGFAWTRMRGCVAPPCRRLAPSATTTRQTTWCGCCKRPKIPRTAPTSKWHSSRSVAAPGRTACRTCCRWRKTATAPCASSRCICWRPPAGRRPWPP